MKLKISERALYARVYRRLWATEVSRPHKSADPRIGPYYVVDANKNLSTWNVELESLPRQIGAIHSYERLAA